MPTANAEVLWLSGGGVETHFDAAPRIRRSPIGVKVVRPAPSAFAVGVLREISVRARTAGALHSDAEQRMPACL